MKNFVFFEDDATKEKGRKIPSYFIIGLLGYFFLVGYLSSLIDGALPRAVTESEAGNEKFSEERAWKYLREILGTGPRVAGTQYHLEKSIDLWKLLEEKTADSVQNIHMDWQFVTGDYWLDRPPRSIVNMYHNATNIIVILEGESGFNPDGTTKSSILFNCHHDSVPTSPGAADNGVFCATFVETIWLLSKRNAKLKHNLIFLFNGAEETQLQAAHGFLKHPWAKGVTALVNLEGAGTNCKSMLFQVTDARVISAYSRSVRSPNAQALGEVVFGSGIVPSDTDFRIFRDFGQIHGIDVAYSQVGHVYHTRHDSLEVLVEGVIQHSGEMILALAKEMGDSEDFYDKETEITKRMFYDYLNWFMVDYSWTVAHVVDTIMIICAAASVVYYHFMVGFRWSMTRELVISSLVRIVSAAVGFACLWIVTAVMVATTTQLRYLANGWIVVPIFWFPYLIGAVATSQLFDAWRCNKSGLNRVRRMSQAMASTRLILVVISFVLLCIPGTPPIRYVIIMPLFIMSLAAFVSVTAIRKLRMKAWQQLVLECLLCLPSQLFMFIVAVKVNTLMLPIMGRSPTLTPDYSIAALNTLVIVVSCLPLSGIELLFSRLKLWMVCLVPLIICLAVTFSPLHPYSETSDPPVPQRHSWFHTEIRSYNELGVQTELRQGIWFAHTEVNTPRHIPELAESNGITLNNIKSDFESDCSTYTYCNLPMYSPRTTEFTSHSIWVDFPPPNPSDPAPTLTRTNEQCLGVICRLDFSFTGPPHMGIVFWPKLGVELRSWSFDSPLKVTTWLNSRPVYFVFYGRGTFSEVVEPIEFKLTLEVPEGHTGPLLDATLHAHRMSHEEEFTEEYKNLIEAMPDYFNIATFLSTRYNYVF